MSLKLFFLLSVSVPVFYYDFKYKRIPNWLTIGSWCIFAIILYLQSKSIPFNYLFSSLIAIISYILLFYISKKKLGMGDVKLSLLLGGINGIFGWYFTNLIAAVVALIVFFILFINKRVDMKTKIPFGPFLCTGSIAHQILSGHGIL